MSQGWVSASGSHHAKCIYGAENRQQECCCGSEEQYSLPPNSKEENAGGLSSGSSHGARTAGDEQLSRGVEELHSPQTPKLMMRQRQKKLFEELDLSGLESWPPELVDSTLSLLAKYHDVFSLEPSEHGCTHSTKHMIKVTNDTPFKE